MASSQRRQARTTLLALLTSYLRDTTTDTAGFSAYPSEQDVRTFALGENVYQIALSEVPSAESVFGVTIFCALDRAVESRAMNQPWDLSVRIVIRTPISIAGDAESQRIAQKIDEAFYRAGGRVEIKDFDSATPTATGQYLQWQAAPRGDWRFENVEAGEQLALEFTAQYTTPPNSGL